MRTLIIEEEVRNQTEHGRWRVEERIEDSRRHVMARCLDCGTLYKVDLFQLRRKDRANKHCKACSNRVRAVANKLSAGEHLLRAEFREYKKSAGKRNVNWNISETLFRKLLFQNCHYCGVIPSRRIESSWDSILVNGVDRVDNTRGYETDNVVTCCKICNYAKRNMSSEEFLDWIGRVYDFNRSRYGTQARGL